MCSAPRRPPWLQATPPKPPNTTSPSTRRANDTKPRRFGNDAKRAVGLGGEEFGGKSKRRRFSSSRRPLLLKERGLGFRCPFHCHEFFRARNWPTPASSEAWRFHRGFCEALLRVVSLETVPLLVGVAIESAVLEERWRERDSGEELEGDCPVSTWRLQLIQEMAALGKLATIVSFVPESSIPCPVCSPAGQPLQERRSRPRVKTTGELSAWAQSFGWHADQST